MHKNKVVISKLKSFFYSYDGKLYNFISSNNFLRFTLAWFILQAAYIAFSTRIGIPPDENYHLSYIEFIANGGWSPFFDAQTSYFSLGEAVRTPFFIYHYLLSLPYHFIADTRLVIPVLRFMNILVAVGSIYILYKLANVVRVSRAVRNLSIFMLSNTLMFIFISASINYDNFFVFLSLASTLFLLLFIKTPSLFRLLLLSVTLAVGLLVKVSFLPIAAVIIGILLFKFSQNAKNSIDSIVTSASKPVKWNIILGLLLTMLLCLLMHRYAINYVRYQRYTPDCHQVLTLEQCTENAVYARDERLDNMVRPAATKSLPKYILDWGLLMGERTFGIFAHKVSKPTTFVEIGALIFLSFGLIAVCLKYKLRHSDFTLLLVIISFYALVLLFDNYSRYRRYGSFTFAVHGRYLFAVLPLIYLFANNYIFRLFKQKVFRDAYIFVMLLVFIAAGLPSYILITGPDWHTKASININMKLKTLLQ